MAAAHHFIIGGGEMGDRIRSLDWSATSLGPIDAWPQSLRSALSILLPSKAQIALFWGRDFTTLYNDAYRPVFGAKHPVALGQPISRAWDELWRAGLRELFQGVVDTGDAFWARDMPFFMERYGYLEETFFDVSYDPVRDESGAVGGLFCIVSETTGRVVGERRLRLLRDLAGVVATARGVDEVWSKSAAVLSEGPHDVPFALMYEAPAEGGGPPVLKASTGVAAAAERGWPFGDEPVIVDVPATAGFPLTGGPWNEALSEVMVLPVTASTLEPPLGHLVVGISPRRRLDDDYRGFLQLVASNLGSAVASARRSEDERRRAESLAELDRAKTAFFTNISHEFRTPLTLMLAPLQEALEAGVLEGEPLQLVHRNARRLGRLVNGLLDFARIQAGRLKAERVPVDLPAVTLDLVSLFRSAAERAGLTLTVHAGAFSAPVQVDLDMYEKIVSNLLSNAIKYTREGGIEVSLRELPSEVELVVKDSGIGVPADELPRLFERFHRIENAWSRTQEGSGIGLALLRDLVTLHGGEVAAESVEGRGTTLRVVLPRLASGQVAAPGDIVREGVAGHHGLALAEEAAAWATGPGFDIAPTSSASSPATTGAVPGSRILVVDDNEDMRRYLMRLLSREWSVRAAGDGLEALDVAKSWRPDLVVSDIMMPRLDGFGLLAALRESPATRRIPVMLVSARAGEEARIEALRAGADDYVVKPFGSQELVARVESQLLRVRLRTIERDQEQRLTEVFEQAPVGIAVLRGPDHVFEFANEDYLALINRRGIRGRSIREALPELAGQGIYELLDQVYQGGEAFHGRSVRLMVADASGQQHERFFDFVYQPTVDADRRPTGIAVVVYDVTSLTAARREADRANQAKDEFLAMLGHELRNPLAPIVTALHIMRLSGKPAFERERAIVQRQTEHLVRLVDDLLDVSRIATGKVELRRRRLDFREAIGMAVESASPAFDRHQHVFDLVMPDRPLWVEGDPSRLAQVMTNLLVNAAKYTPPNGHLSLVASARGPWIEVLVSDDGIGIAPENLPRIFDLFVQERQPAARSPGGMGLGLAIVRSLVRAHGGEVSAHSAGRGKGSQFRVLLPLAGEIELACEASGRLAGLRARRVMLVDDDAEGASALAHALESRGLIVEIAPDGPRAIERVEPFAPDVAIIDLGLPLMDGEEVARRIALMRPGTHLVGLGGYGDPGHQALPAMTSFAARVQKPVDLDVLVKAASAAEQVSATR